MQRRIPNLYNKERIRGLYEGLYAELAADAAGPAQDCATAPEGVGAAPDASRNVALGSLRDGLRLASRLLSLSGRLKRSEGPAHRHGVRVVSTP